MRCGNKLPKPSTLNSHQVSRGLPTCMQLLTSEAIYDIAGRLCWAISPWNRDVYRFDQKVDLTSVMRII